MILEELATRLAWVLIHSLWQGTLIGIVALILLKLIRGAAARHALGVGAMLLILVMAIYQFGEPRTKETEAAVPEPPTLIDAGPTIEKSIQSSTSTPEATDVGLAETFVIQDPPFVLPSHSLVEEPRAAEPATPFNFLPWLSALWLIGVVVLVLRHLGGWWLLRRWRTEGVSPIPATLESRVSQITDRLQLTRQVPLFLSSRVAMPLLVGVIKPVILLPASLVSRIPPAELDALIAHELAHLRRRDSWANHLQIVIETFLFFHPAIWILGRITRHERENAADDLALESGLDQKTYARALASVAELSAQNGSLALAASDGVLLSRIRRIMHADKARRISPATGWLGSLALAMTAALFMGTAPASEADEKKDPAEIIKVVAGESIQAAIDKAKVHSVIEIGAGTFEGEIVINRPLTLRGAGWNETIITSKAGDPRTMTSTMEIKGAKEVFLENLQVTKMGVAAKAESENTLVVVRGSRIRIKNCALLGPASTGLILLEGSQAKVESSLVAAVWRTGIMVRGKKDVEPSTLHLNRSIVRSCYHRCVTLGAGCDDSKITNSWISGSAWHGIRYDSASPHIEGNYIGGNARSGIYASGKTKATVKNNVFVGNEMGGMSCWFNNEDHIEGNRFVNNHREGIMVIGSSKPLVKSNVFFQKNGPAIWCSKTSKDPAIGDPRMENNVADFGVLPFRSLEEDVTEVEGITISPKPLQGEVGAKFETLNLLWPELLPQEKSMVPDEETRDFQKWKTPENEQKKHQVKLLDARKRSQQWIADAFQLGDIAKRELAIKEILNAVKSKDPLLQLAGLKAFTSTSEVRYEKALFHDPAAELLTSPDPAVRSQAASALLLSGIKDGDLDRLVKLTHDDSAVVRLTSAGTLIRALKKDLTRDPFAKRIAALLEDEATQKDVLQQLWGARLSPGIEAAVLKLSNTTKVSAANTNDIAYTALYYALSTQANKSEATVKRLIEYFAAEDTHNISGRAAWGLGQGVAPEQYDLVVKGALMFMSARTPQSYAFRQLFDRVKQYSAKRHLPELRKLLALPGVEGEFKQDLEELIARLEK